MSAEENIRIMREIFSAIERRDAQRFLDLCDPKFEFHWPPSLPYGGITYGRDQEGFSWGKSRFLCNLHSSNSACPNEKVSA
jgi:ketosteroid isomerase-like protein